MTSKEKRIQEEVNKTMGLLDSWEKPAVNPFFYGKLSHRMSSLKPKSQGAMFVFLPKIALATLAILFVCNLFTLVNSSNPTDSASAGLTNFAEQYNISVSQ